jgi:hypothetical protein
VLNRSHTIITKYESLHKFEVLYNKKQSDSDWTAKLVIENEIYVNQPTGEAYIEVWMNCLHFLINLSIFLCNWLVHSNLMEVLEGLKFE